jgi:hypothetical protein
MHVPKWILRLLAVVAGLVLCGIAGLVCGVVGLLLGMHSERWIDYAEDFTFNRGYSGYEAGGRLGFVAGFVVGCIGAGAAFVISVVILKRLRNTGSGL